VRGLLRTLTTPRTSFLLFFGSLWAWHVPFLYNLALENAAIHLVEHMLFFVPALLFWGAVIDPVPFPPRLGYLLRVLYLLGAAAADGALGAILAYFQAPWYAFYTRGQGLWGFTPQEDQYAAGLVMWLPSWAVFLLAISVIFFLMMGEEERSLQARAAGAGGRPE
jgi:cytochrome c oxidase assembly factor CtaG